MPRVSIRDLSRILIGLTSDRPFENPPLSDEITLVELLGDSRRAIAPAVRPRMGAGNHSLGAFAAVFGVLQLRAGTRPCYVQTHVSPQGNVSRYRIGADLIDANRASGVSFRYPEGSALVEGGTTAAIVNTDAAVGEANRVYTEEWYLEPGEVLSWHHQTANTALEAFFSWFELPGP